MIQIKAALAEGWRGLGLRGSPLLADFGPTDRAWWRLPLGFACGAIAAVIALVVAVIFMGIAFFIIAGPAKAQADLAVMQAYVKGAEPGFVASLLILASVPVINGGAALVFTAVASLVSRKPFRKSFTTAPRWRWGQLAVGLVVNMILLAPLMAFDVLRGGTPAKWPLLTLCHSPAQMAVYAITAIVCLTLAAGAEELVFRGWFLRQSAVVFRLTWLFLLLNGVLFSAAHGDFDPNAFMDRACAGIGLCYIALRCGGIEFSTGAHTANNLLIVLFIEPLTLAVPPPMPPDPISMVESVIGLLLSVVGVELALRWAPLRRLMQPVSETVQTGSEEMASVF